MNVVRRLVAVLSVVSLASIAGSALAQAASDGIVHNVGDVKFAAFPGMPTCTMGSVQAGDPAKGASVILAKMATGCVFPWHWHTPNEHVMIVSGTARVEMRNAKAVTLKSGGFALMPSHHAHQFHCTKSCLLYVYSDTAFDMHFVNDKDQEISPDEALARVKEKAAAPPK